MRIPLEVAPRIATALTPFSPSPLAATDSLFTGWYNLRPSQHPTHWTALILEWFPPLFHCVQDGLHSLNQVCKDQSTIVFLFWRSKGNVMNQSHRLFGESGFDERIRMRCIVEKWIEREMRGKESETMDPSKIIPSRWMNGKGKGIHSILSPHNHEQIGQIQLLKCYRSLPFPQARLTFKMVLFPLSPAPNSNNLTSLLSFFSSSLNWRSNARDCFASGESAVALPLEEDRQAPILLCVLKVVDGSGKGQSNSDENRE